MSHDNMSSTFSAAIVNAIRTDSLDTTYEYTIDAGAVVVCLTTTSRAFYAEVFTQFDVKDNVAFDFLVADW